MIGKVITANRLLDGEVVYLAPGGSWSKSLSEARFLTKEREQTRLLRVAETDVTRQIIVGPYLMDAERRTGTPSPISKRESIRAKGPTVRVWFR